MKEMPGNAANYGVGLLRGAEENISGYEQAAGLKNEADIKTWRESLPDDTASKIGRGVGSALFDPLNAVPGGGVLKAAAIGAGSGLMRPHTSGDERAINIVTSGALGPLGHLAGKILPSTAAGPRGPSKDAIATAKELNVSPTNVQLNPDDIGSRLFAPLDRRSAAGQQEALTQGVMKAAGMKGSELTHEGFKVTAKELGQEFNTLLPTTVYPKIGAAEQKALKDAISQIPQVKTIMKNKEAPALNQVYKALSSGTPPKVSAATLHQAYREISDVVGGNTGAAGEIRDIVSGLITKSLSSKPGGVQRFAELNSQWGNLKDLERAWAQGSGGGFGGTIRPAALEEWAGKHPGDSLVGRAGGAVKQLGMKDYVPGAVPDVSITNPFTWPGLISEVPGAQYFNKSMVNSPEAIKKTIEALRTAGRLGPREYSEQN
jgi:hypothetical protein